MKYTTIAIRPETKRLMDDYKKDKLGFKSFDGIINHFLTISQNARRVAKRSATASGIFDIFIRKYPEYWGTLQSEILLTATPKTLRKYLTRKKEQFVVLENPAKKDYDEVRDEFLDMNRPKRRRSPKGKTLGRKVTRARPRSKSGRKK